MRDKDTQAAGDPDSSTKSGASQAEPITVVDAIEAIRLRPKMYIATDLQAGLTHLLDAAIHTLLRYAAREIRSLADMSFYGSMRNIEITFHAEQVVTITDDGPGLSPQPIGAEGMKSVAEVLLSLLPIGMPAFAVTNALSQWLELKIWRDGHQWEQSYHQGRPQSELRKVCASEKHGDSIRFLPDPIFFRNAQYDFDHVAQWFRERAPKLERKIEELAPTAPGWYDKALRDEHSLFRNARFTIIDERPCASSTNGERCVTFNG